MLTEMNASQTLARELNKFVATASLLAEYAAEQGDRQSAMILANVADLLELTVAHKAIDPTILETGTTLKAA